MIIQKQTWNQLTRYLIYTNVGSIQVEIYPDKKAFMHSLWVEKYARKSGIGTTLFKLGEATAIQENCVSISFEWYLRDSPKWVLDWYKEMGYKEEYTNEGAALLRKILR